MQAASISPGTYAAAAAPPILVARYRSGAKLALRLARQEIRSKRRQGARHNGGHPRCRRSRAVTHEMEQQVPARHTRQRGH